MPLPAALRDRMDDWIRQNRGRIIGLTTELVRISSETDPPGGNEQAAQEFLADACERHGLPVELYDIGSVAGIEEHPLHHPGARLAGRPNVAVRRPGRRGADARSLILSGHMDTVPAGDPGTWADAPTSGRIVSGKLYGRGAYDMKAGVAANFMTLMMLDELGIELDGDLLVESVVDEEFAGGHGTLAARLHSGGADAVLLPEPSNLVPYRAHRGLRIARLAIHGTGGVTFAGDQLRPAVHQLPAVIQGLTEFVATRNARLVIPEAYQHMADPASAMVTKVRANDWGDAVRLAVPEIAEVEFFWETLPGETQAEVEQEFETWLATLRTATSADIRASYWLRWMAGYQLAREHPLVPVVEQNLQDVTGNACPATGAPFPCDLFLFKELGVPAGMILGPSGNNAHAPDEWVDVESIVQLVRAYGRIVVDWCNQPRGEMQNAEA
jgi:acetylornithine deacetylase